LSLVLDTSLTLSWYFEDERTPAADAVLDRVVDEGAVVPALWKPEVANGLQVAIRRKRIDVQFRDDAISQLAAMPIVMDLETDIHAWTTTLHLADQYR
jgi:predicted nucleic acid-binding protein